LTFLDLLNGLTFQCRFVARVISISGEKERYCVMDTARPSVTKRQREQTKKERQGRKAEKRAERKNDPAIEILRH